MDSMETRRNAIVDLINENGTVSFSQLKDAFPHVSEMTLRTDLQLRDEAVLKQTAIRQSDQVIVLMDSSKLGLKCSFNICGLEAVDIVVSDGKLPKEFLEECKKHKVEVL